MAKKQKILELRERLDKTLASPCLTNEESINSLVKNQLLRSSFSGSKGDHANVIQKHAKEVSNFLEMLRSASGNNRDPLKAHGTSHTDWKLKQDTDQLRVMYREGPQGTPFHTLLAEGYADGPIDVCLCVSWEATLYKKWWPQYSIPPFKILASTCLQKVRIGEEISLVRVKVPWPMSNREAVLHNFELEYFEEDLLLVILNTIPDREHVDLSVHGFTKDGIPEAKDTVRIDLVGGFVLQKVNPTRCYFRMIANMDIKLDFVPPSLINFISRQLIGNGHKLYQKAVASVATSDEDYRRALKGEMYVRIREGLDPSYRPPNTIIEGIKDEEKPTALAGDCEDAAAPANMPVMDNKLISEIEEEEAEQDEGIQLTDNTPTNLTAEQRKISPDMDRALSILDKAIAIVRDRRSSDSNRIEGLSSDLELQTSERVEVAACPNERDEPEKATMDKSRTSPCDGRRPSDAAATTAITLTEPPPTLDHMSRVFDEVSGQADGTCRRRSGRYELNRQKRKKQQHRHRCLCFT